MKFKDIKKLNKAANTNESFPKLIAELRFYNDKHKRITGRYAIDLDKIKQNQSERSIRNYIWFVKFELSFEEKLIEFENNAKKIKLNEFKKKVYVV